MTCGADRRTPAPDATNGRMRRALVLAFALVACGGSSAVPNDGGNNTDAAEDASPADSGAPRDAAVFDAPADAAATLGKYDKDGPDSVTTATAQLTSGPSTFTERLWVPGSSGPHPVVSLSPGLQQPAIAYAPYGKRLASWGFVVMMRDDPGVLVQTPTVAADLAYAIGTWLPAANADAQSPLFGKVDAARVGLAGHSRGGQATLVAAEGGLKGKVKAWFGLDPVDSNVSNAQARTNLPQIGIPTTFLGATVSGACSPMADNYTVLYGLAPSPAVRIDGLGAGHVQFEDPATCVLCGLCSPAGTADSAVVLAYSVRYLTAFFARELQSDASVGAAFQGAGAALDVAANRVTIASK